jgi:hypothetical protein
VALPDGEGVDDLILAYYPTPAPSPRRGSVSDPFLSMTPLSGASTPRTGRSRRGSSISITSQEARSEILARVRRGSSGAGGMSQSLAMSTLPNSLPSVTRRMSDGQSMGMGSELQPMTRRKSSRTKSTGERDAELKRLRAMLEERKKREAEEVAKHKEGLFAEQESTPVASTSKPHPHMRTSRLRCKLCRLAHFISCHS